MSTEAAWDNLPQFTVADFLRKARLHAGLEQAELAEEIGVSRGTIRNYEMGHVKPRKIVLNAWAMRTGVPLEWITSLGTTNPRPDQGPDGGGECAIRDSNPEPADYEPQPAAEVIHLAPRRATTAPLPAAEPEPAPLRKVA